jgi:hypothetical protein
MGSMGQTDQIVRGVVGALLVLIAGTGVVHGPWQVVLLVLGSIGVFTASSGFCPVYRLLGRTSRHAS